VITQDVLPFSNTVTEREARIFGANVTGLKRRSFPPATIDGLHKAFRLLTHSGLNTTQAIERIKAEIEASGELDALLNFIATSSRGFVK
jgi:UDP-N-acetylglucosamine acyltransferase